MLELAGDERFVLEAGEGLEVLGAAVDQFDGDGALEGFVPRGVDGPHAALREQALQFVAIADDGGELGRWRVRPSA